MPKYATKFEILRGVSPTSRQPCKSQPSAKPVRVVFLLNEQKFIQSGGLMVHWDTVFFEDSTHDWDWRNGQFYYYGHAIGVEDIGDIVVVLEETERATETTTSELLKSGHMAAEAQTLSLWTIYDSPIDLPGRFVARKWLGNHPTNELLQDKTLDGLRLKLPQGLLRLDRSPQDDPKIVETWI